MQISIEENQGIHHFHVSLQNSSSVRAVLILDLFLIVYIVIFVDTNNTKFTGAMSVNIRHRIN